MKRISNQIALIRRKLNFLLFFKLRSIRYTNIWKKLLAEKRLTNKKCSNENRNEWHELMRWYNLNAFPSSVISFQRYAQIINCSYIEVDKNRQSDEKPIFFFCSVNILRNGIDHVQFMCCFYESTFWRTTIIRIPNQKIFRST